jgi:hypothetical protein
MASSVTSAATLLPFLIIPLHESGFRKALLHPQLNKTAVYMTPLLKLKIS